MFLYRSLLSKTQYNILLASILADGSLTKISKKSRRINSNYRENFGKSQLGYRTWKVKQLDELLYFNKMKSEILSKSQPLFTELERIFYTADRIKQIPSEILHDCTLPHFLAVLYMDDGSLSITNRINHRLKKIYLTPHIYLYLQSFSKSDLQILCSHIKRHFGVKLVLSKRNDGNGYVLKTTAVEETYKFLEVIRPVTMECQEMNYKTHWNYRLDIEKEIWAKKLPGYQVIASSSERSKAYSGEEIDLLIKLKLIGYTDKEVSAILNRSYWSIVYKWAEIRKNSKQLIQK